MWLWLHPVPPGEDRGGSRGFDEDEKCIAATRLRAKLQGLENVSSWGIFDLSRDRDAFDLYAQHNATDQGIRCMAFRLLGVYQRM